MKLSKKSRIVFTTVAALVLVALAVVGFFVYESNKPYREKSEIGFAMGSVVTVKTFGSKADGIERDIVDKLESYGDVLSDKAFDLSNLSSKFYGDSPIFDAEETEMIIKTKEIYSKTDGKAALTVGALSELWDFNSGKNTVPDREAIKTALETVDDNNLIIKSGEVRPFAGTSMLDLGSVGKGFACDKAAKVLEENGIENAVIAVGGSIYAKGYTAEDKPIRVGVRNPFGSENDYFGYISTDNAFISTSGNYEKVFEVDGKKYHHLLDCTTGYPVEGDLVSVTVVCDCGYLSDALSTACFVMGYGEKTISLLKENNAKAIFVFEDKSVKISSELSDFFTLTDNSFSVTGYEA